MRAAFVMLVVIGLVGCEAAGDRDPKSLAERVVVARERMHERYTAASSMQRAIGFGDLRRRARVAAVGRAGCDRRASHRAVRT